MAGGQFTHLRGGWRVEIKFSEGDNACDARIYHPVGDGGDGLKFYEVTTMGNQYGAPMVVQEPTLGIPLRACGVDVDDKLVGAIVMGPLGVVLDRVSWSNLVHIKGGSFRITIDGELFVNDVTKGYLAMVFLPDKNRMRGYVGVFVPTKPEAVRVCEMEDLVIAALRTK